MSTSSDVLIVGAGVFGLTAAIELRSRGYQVSILDPGPIPHPLAASTDISKVVRMEYGMDEQYMAMVEQALPGFETWNQELDDPGLYHGTGITLLTLDPLKTGGFEHHSLKTLLGRGHAPTRLTGTAIRERFPAWSAAFADGFYHAKGGWVESGRLIAALSRKALQAGVAFHADSARAFGDHTVTCQSGRTLKAEAVIVAAGAWTPVLVPDLQPQMKTSGHAVFHLRPDDPALFSEPTFTTFMADVARTGWYGFPLHPREGVVKVANHGIGRIVHPQHGAREVYPEDHRSLRAFLAMALPALASAPVVYTRRCLYCDTLDGHLWIDRHPDKPWLMVASGGSGHAMKFAPVLGPLIADALDGTPNPWLPRFRWREIDPNMGQQEASRHKASGR